MKYLFVTNGFLLNCIGYAQATENSKIASVETIVFMRHGEKSEDEIGQLSCQGLNRALKLPQVLLTKFGKPDYLFAPNPNDKVENKDTDESYFYTRPLIALAPLAIRINQPIDLTYGYSETENITKELVKNKYKNSLIFVAWEHKKLRDIVKDIYKLDSDNEGSDIPKWEKTDFDSLYILEVKKNKDEKIKQVTFRVEPENIVGLSQICPT